MRHDDRDLSELCERARRACEEAAQLSRERGAILAWIRSNVADLRAKAAAVSLPTYPAGWQQATGEQATAPH